MGSADWRINHRRNDSGSDMSMDPSIEERRKWRRARRKKMRSQKIKKTKPTNVGWWILEDGENEVSIRSDQSRWRAARKDIR